MAQGFALLGNPRVRYWDVNGTAPLAFGKMYFYAAGTSTPQNTWSNSDLSSLNTNPLTLSASGQGTVFVPAATLYKIDLYDANGVQQEGYPLDGVEALPAPDPPAPTPSPVPTGGVIWSPYSTTPSGFLPLIGALVSRVTYAALNALAAADGYPNGAGDGVTTFQLADTRGRAPYGLAVSGTGSTLGGTFGAIDHTHTGPSHTHGGTFSLSHQHTVTAAAHTHVAVVPRGSWGSLLNTPSVSQRLVVGDAATNFNQATIDQSVTTSADGALAAVLTSAVDPGGAFTTSAAGTGATGTANPPGIVGYWFIKT